MAKRKSVIINGTETCKSGGYWPGSSYNHAWTSDVGSYGFHVVLGSPGGTYGAAAASSAPASPFSGDSDKPKGSSAGRKAFPSRSVW